MADPRRLHLGALALLSNAGLYTLVYVFLVMGRGRPTAFKPWLAGYLAAFVVLFSKGIAAAQGVRRGHAALLGTTAFAAYQLMFVLFNR